MSRPKAYTPSAVTVCIATMALDKGEPVILLAADKKLSWGYDSVKNALKVRRVHENWLFAFATASTANSANLFEDIRRSIKPVKNLKTMQSKVLEVHRQYGDAWEFLFAGFDKSSKSHIFRVSKEGIFDCDLNAYGCVGSGDYLAQFYLSSYPYEQALPLAESIYCTLAAKFTAERADGIGDTTTLAVLRPNQAIPSAPTAVPTIEKDVIDHVRAKWESLPRIPEGLKDDIEGYVAGKNRFVHKWLKPSASSISS